jgi:hypothetical protein
MRSCQAVAQEKAGGTRLNQPREEDQGQQIDA